MSKSFSVGGSSEDQDEEAAQHTKWSRLVNEFRATTKREIRQNILMENTRQRATLQPRFSVRIELLISNLIPNEFQLQSYTDWRPPRQIFIDSLRLKKNKKIMQVLHSSTYLSFPFGKFIQGIKTKNKIKTGCPISVCVYNVAHM